MNEHQEAYKAIESTLKGELKFTFDPESAYDNKRMSDIVRGLDYRYERIVDDLLNNLRSWLKHGHAFKTADEALETIKQQLHEAAYDAKVGE